MSPTMFKRLSDESLGSRLASGEAAAFDELYRRYVNRLSAYGAHLLGDVAAGDDVAQTALFKAYGALRDGRVPHQIRPWLYRIAHNAAIDLVARRRELPSANLPETPAVDREPFAGALVEALATLPERQRRVYLLREVHGLRIDETAAELGLNASQIEQSLFAARNRLAEQLVFGDRLNCVTVQRLAAGPLDAPERRALKTHLRSCTECRHTLGLRGRALSLFPSSVGLEWLRGLGAGLIGGGGAPAVAKIGAVVATATFAAGVPVAVVTSKSHHRAQPPISPRRSKQPAAVALAAPSDTGALHRSAARQTVSFSLVRPAAVVRTVSKARAVDDGAAQRDSAGEIATTEGGDTPSSTAIAREGDTSEHGTPTGTQPSGEHSHGEGTGSSTPTATTHDAPATGDGSSGSSDSSARSDGSGDGSDGSTPGGDGSGDSSGDGDSTANDSATDPTTPVALAPAVPPLPLAP